MKRETIQQLGNTRKNISFQAFELQTKGGTSPAARVKKYQMVSFDLE